MNTLGDNVEDRAVGGDGPRPRPRFVVHALAAAVLALGLVGSAVAPALGLPGTAVAPALADTQPGVDAATSNAETPTSSPTPIPQGHLTPGPGSSASPIGPSIDDPGDITSGTVRLSGSAFPGHLLRVTGPAATGSTGCSATVQRNGSWACLATVRSGPQQVFTVRDATTPGVSPASTPASDVIVPPVVTTSRPTSGPVSGTGYPGSTVTLSLSGSNTTPTAIVAADGHWTAALDGATAGPTTGQGAGAVSTASVTATQTASTADGFRSELRSASSAPVTITVDRSAPDAPRITAPGSGDRVRTQPVTVSGRGEPAALVTVYVDRAPVCRTTVSAAGRWSCTTAGSTLRPGTRAITAVQQDAAGNTSRTSTELRVVVTPESAFPGGTGNTGGSGSTGTGTGTPGGTTGPDGTGGTTGTGTSTNTPAGTTGGTGGSGGGPTAGGGPGSTAAGGTGSGANGSGATGSGSAGGPSSGRHGLDWSGPAGDWAASTAYDRTVPTIQTAFSWQTALVAAAVAAGFLLLVAGPLALVAGVTRGRIRSPFAALLGRNRSTDERRRAEDLLPTWATITTAVVVVALCTLLGVGVSLEARYVRLAVAVLVGAAVLTTTVVLATRWAAGTDRHTVGYRVSPWLVLAALVACAVTRAADLSPALIVGAVVVPVVRPGLDTGALRLGSSVVAGARSATWRSVALLVVAAVGWVLHSVTPGSGFWGSVVSEFAITLCVGGLGAVVTTLLPLTGSAGQTLLTTARGRYVALAAVAVALSAAVYSGPLGTHCPPVALTVVGATCTAGAVVAVLWQRRAQRVAS